MHSVSFLPLHSANQANRWSVQGEGKQTHQRSNAVIGMMPNELNRRHQERKVGAHSVACVPSQLSQLFEANSLVAVWDTDVGVVCHWVRLHGSPVLIHDKANDA